MSIVSSILCEEMNGKLFTNPSKVDSDVQNIDNSLAQVKELLEKLDANQFKGLNDLVNKIQDDLRRAKHDFDVDNDFDKLGEKVQDLKTELNQFAPKLRYDLQNLHK